MDSYLLNETNTGQKILASITVPITWRPMTNAQVRMAGEGWDNVDGSYYGPNPPTGPTPPDGYWQFPYNTSSTGAWTEGGVATIGRSLTIGSNIAPAVANGAAWVYTGPAAPQALHIIYMSTLKSTLAQYTVEIDWQKTMAAVQKQFSNYLYQIGAAEFTDGSGENGVDLIGEGYVSLEDMQKKYNRFNSEEEDSSNPISYTDTTSTSEYQSDYGVGNGLSYFTIIDWANSYLQGSYPGSTFGDDAKGIAGGGSVSDTRQVPMYLTIHFISAEFAGPDMRDPEEIEQGDDEASDSSISTGNGSLGNGMNRTNTNYGNSQLPFDSVYMTGENYGVFYSSGGGVVSESGVFPNTEVFFVDKVRLSVEGSTATIVEHVEFDNTPSLSIGEKIFIYILDSTNPNQPVFAGYVNSYSRELTASGQRIVYECKDLVAYLDQFVSPSYFVYRPPLEGQSGTLKTYEQILKEILNVAGIPNAIVSLPTVTAPPVNWVYETVDSILEWALKMFGKYVYYVDRNGRLRIRASDSGSVVKSFRIPSPGDAVGSHVVTSFQPVVDNSRARGRIILTGDFALKEHKAIVTYTNTSDELIYRTQEPLIDRLLSNPQSGPQVFLSDRLYTYTVGGQTYTFPDVIERELSITQLATEPGNSFIYIKDSAIRFTGKTTFVIKYATRSNSLLQVYSDTGYDGGTEVIKRPEFKKVSAPGVNIDDTTLMQQYLSMLKDYYKPVYGGTLNIVGLDTGLQLLDKVSITNTSLPTAEASSLTIYELEYDIPNKTTSIGLSNRVYYGMPFFDIIRERSRAANESLVKAGLVELDSLYKRV